MSEENKVWLQIVQQYNVCVKEIQFYFWQLIFGGTFRKKTSNKKIFFSEMFN